MWRQSAVENSIYATSYNEKLKIDGWYIFWLYNFSNIIFEGEKSEWQDNQVDRGPLCGTDRNDQMSINTDN